MISSLYFAIADTMTHDGKPTGAGEIVKVSELRWVYCVVVRDRAARFVSKRKVAAWLKYFELRDNFIKEHKTGSYSDRFTPLHTLTEAAMTNERECYKLTSPVKNAIALFRSANANHELVQDRDFGGSYSGYRVYEWRDTKGKVTDAIALYSHPIPWEATGEEKLTSVNGREFFLEYIYYEREEIGVLLPYAEASLLP